MARCSESDVATGRAFRRGTAPRLLACGIAATVIALDFGAFAFRAPAARAVLGLAALLALALVARDRASLGLCVRPRPRWAYWLRATVWAGLAVAGFAGLATGVLWIAGHGISLRSMFADLPPERVVALVWSVLVVYPLVEELLYRAILVPPLAAAVGRWPAIAISGAVFAALHFRYGNPGVDNFVAGFVLGWAFLRSGSLLIPIALHVLGNGCVLAVHAGLLAIPR